MDKLSLGCQSVKLHVASSLTGVREPRQIWAGGDGHMDRRGEGISMIVTFRTSFCRKGPPSQKQPFPFCAAVHPNPRRHLQMPFSNSASVSHHTHSRHKQIHSSS